jgi:hypothetical protein
MVAVALACIKDLLSSPGPHRVVFETDPALLLRGHVVPPFAHHYMDHSVQDGILGSQPGLMGWSHGAWLQRFDLSSSTKQL